jgi:hypothetical protein
MYGVSLTLAAVALLITGYGLVWLFRPDLRDWMESPRDRFLELQRRFPRVVRRDAARPDRADSPVQSAPDLVRSAGREMQIRATFTLRR